MPAGSWFPLNVRSNPRTCMAACVLHVGARGAVASVVLSVWLAATGGRATLFWDVAPEWVYIVAVTCASWADFRKWLGAGVLESEPAYRATLIRGGVKDVVWLGVTLGVLTVARWQFPFRSGFFHLWLLLGTGVLGLLLTSFLVEVYRATVHALPSFHGPVIRGKGLRDLGELSGESRAAPPRVPFWRLLLGPAQAGEEEDDEGEGHPLPSPAALAAAEVGALGGGLGDQAQPADGGPEPLPTKAPAPLYPWGGLLFSAHQLEPHYAVVGATGSGKTLTILMLMNRVLGGSGGAPRHRAVVYDPKLEMYPLLRGIGVGVDRIVVLHPFDQRSSAWDIAADVCDETTTDQVASILIPKDRHETQPFFSDAARDLLSNVIRVLAREGRKDWNLNDVVESVTALPRLKEVLSLTSEGRDVYDSYVKEENTTALSILSTLRTKVAPYATVARLWARSQHRVSLSSWFAEESPRVLLLGTDDRNSQALSPINRAMFLRASQLVTGQVGDATTESWFFLDELSLAGDLEGLSPLLLKGRSKGAHVVVGFQDIEGLKDVYRQGPASEMLGQCGNMAVLRLNSAETATWASRYFGEYEYHRYSFSHSTTQGKHTQGLSWSNEKREAILPAQFQQFELARPEVGVMGAFATPAKNGWVGTVQPSFMRSHLPRRGADASFAPRPGEDQLPLPWTDEDRRRLGLGSESRRDSKSKQRGLRIPKSLRAAGAAEDDEVEAAGDQPGATESKDQRPRHGR